MTSEERRTHRWIAATLSLAVLVCLAPLAMAQDGGQPAEADTPSDAAPGDVGTDSEAAPAADADAPGDGAAPAEGDAADSPGSDGAPAAAPGAVAASFEDLMAVDVPDGWRMRLVYADTEARAYLVDSPIEGLPAIEVHVLNLETRDVDLTDGKAVNRLASQLVYRYLAIEKQVDFQARGRIQLKLDGCDALSHTYRDGEREIRVIGCAHPSARRLYVFRFDIPEVLKDNRESIIKSLNGLLLERVSMVAAAAPAPPAPTDAPPEPGGAEVGAPEDAGATTP